MPTTPDTSILDLILAGELAAASDAIDAGWPGSLFDLVQASAYQATAAGRGASGSSVAISTGSKTFALFEPRGWPAGTPVYVMADSSPETLFMVGKLSAAETGEGVLTVDVTSVGGSGTYTAWTILALFAAIEVASLPVAIAGGGTGADSAAGARASLELARRKPVAGVLATPPGSPSVGAVYAVLASPSGAWATHPGYWATWSGGDWDFEGPAVGDQSLDLGSGKTFAAVSGGWSLLAAESPGRPAPLRVVTTPAAVTAADLAAAVDLLVYLGDAGDPIVLTLPDAAAAAGSRVTVANRGSAEATINVSGGGTINGASSLALAANSAVDLAAFSTTYVVSGIPTVLKDWLIAGSHTGGGGI